MSADITPNVLTAIERAEPVALRLAVRAGRYTGYTAGLASNYVQANIYILPGDWADEFLLFGQRNHQACPILARSEPGNPRLAKLGQDLDVRTDVPRYNVFIDGTLSQTVTDIKEIWRDDFVAFAIGCSFSFEEALLASGLRLRFLDRGDVAGIYVTNIEAEAAGRFRGPVVVSMRPFVPRDAIRAIQITSRFPNAHGAPIHLAYPAQIGVDLDHPYQGIGSSEVAEGEMPVFWACGLTPHLAIAHAKPPICITHAPSSMLVTDLRNAALSIL